MFNICTKAITQMYSSTCLFHKHFPNTPVGEFQLIIKADFWFAVMINMYIYVQYIYIDMQYFQNSFSEQFRVSTSIFSYIHYELRLSLFLIWSLNAYICILGGGELGQNFRHFANVIILLSTWIQQVNAGFICDLFNIHFQVYTTLNITQEWLKCRLVAFKKKCNYSQAD